MAKVEYSFSACHFIPMLHKCSRMHGHRYRLVVHTDVPENLDAVQRVVAQLDGKVLAPEALCRREGDKVVVSFEDGEYHIPAEHIFMLPSPNATAECIASHIARGLRPPYRVMLFEGPRQAAVVEEGP